MTKMIDLEKLQADTRHKALIDKDNKCPCCLQRYAADSRKVYAEPALFLLKLVRAYESDKRPWKNKELLPNKTKSSTDGSYMVHWGLIERLKNGVYIPTEDGIRFIHEEIRVSKEKMIVGNHVLRTSEDSVSISEALGSSLDYDELMDMPLNDLFQVDGRRQ